MPAGQILTSAIGLRRFDAGVAVVSHIDGQGLHRNAPADLSDKTSLASHKFPSSVPAPTLSEEMGSGEMVNSTRTTQSLLPLIDARSLNKLRLGFSSGGLLHLSNLMAIVWIEASGHSDSGIETLVDTTGRYSNENSTICRVGTRFVASQRQMCLRGQLCRPSTPALEH